MPVNVQSGYNTYYPKNASPSDTVALSGNGANADIWALVPPAQLLLLQNNISTAGTVRVAWGTGPVPTQAPTFYPFTIPSAGNEILQLGVAATWVALSGPPLTPLNNDTVGITLLGGV